MELDTSLTLPTNKSSPGPGNLGEIFDEDNISFQPITEGLGFHQEEIERLNIEKMFRPNINLRGNRANNLSNSGSANNIGGVSNQNSVNKTSNFNGMVSIKGVKNHSSQNHTKPVLNLSNCSDNNPQANFSHETISKKETITKGEAKNTAKFYQFSAWLIDILMITAVTSVTIIFFTLIAIFITSNSPSLDLALAQRLIINVQDWEFYLYLTFIFLIFYFLYFIFLDQTNMGTLGKKLFKIRLVGSTLEPVSTKVAGFRSLIVLLSPLSFGIPLLLNFQDKLTNSKIICE